MKDDRWQGMEANENHQLERQTFESIKLNSQ